MIPGSDNWTDRIADILNRYDAGLLRQVAGKLCRPRSQWPREELVERSLATLSNPPVLDRRLKELSPPGRRLIALISHGRQMRWSVGLLMELQLSLGEQEGLAAILELLQAGLLYPDLPPGDSRPGPRNFSQWLEQTLRPQVLCPPSVSQRLLREPLAWPDLPEGRTLVGPVLESDGLEWLLRLGVLWQQILAGPLRRTQQGEFFKRDLERLRNDPLLVSHSEMLEAIPDPGIFAVTLGLAAGVLTEENGEIRASDFPLSWSSGLADTLIELWSGLPRLSAWSPAEGWRSGDALGQPHASALFLAMLLLSQLPENDWIRPDAVETWIQTHHPYWSHATTPQPVGMPAFLLGVAYPLRLVQAVKTPEDDIAVRLSPVGRWVLGFSDSPPSLPHFQQTLLVQPNLEILAYRQGLTPELIVRLGKCATWKALGAACTLQLEPNSVYRALEQGETLESLLMLLDRHGMKPTPAPVIDALRTWSNKRERITVYPSAALFEFATPADLNEALARGLPAVRLTDRLAVVVKESEIDYKHFRLTGTRDYCLPPERCVEVDPDGVTLSIDLARSDLLLETEVQRFADPVVRSGLPQRRFYQITPGSLLAGRKKGVTLQGLEGWFPQRTGLPLSPAVRLLLSAAESAPWELKRQVVLYAPSADFADGLEQWPETQPFIHGRLGPTALLVLDRDVEVISQKLQSLGMRVLFENV